MTEGDNSLDHRRRKILEMLGAASVTSIAGCGGNGDGSNPTPTSTPTKTSGLTPEQGSPTQSATSTSTATSDATPTPLPQVDQTYTVAHRDSNIKEKSFYLYGWSMPYISSFCFNGNIWQLSGYSLPYSKEGEFELINYSDLYVHDNGRKVTAEYKDGITWSDGTPVTGDDLKRYIIHVAMLWWGQHVDKIDLAEMRDPLMAIQAPPDGVWYEDAIKTTDNSITLISDPGWFAGSNTKFARYGIKGIMKGMPHHPPIDPYQKHIEEYLSLYEKYDDPYNAGKNDGIAPELADLRGKVYGASVPLTEHPQIGPFYIDDYNESKYFLKAHEGNALVDDPINWPTVEAQYMDEQTERKAVTGGLVTSSSVHLPSHSLDALPEEMSTFTYPNASGRALQVYHSHPWYGDPRVRQALMYAIDQKTVANFLEGQAVARSNPIKIPGAHSQVAQLIDDSVLEKFNRYPKNPDKVASKLKAAGFSKQKGDWVGPDGKKFKAKIQTTANVPTFETVIAQQLNSVGIPAETFTMDSATFNKQLGNGNYEVVGTNWGGERTDIFNFWFWSVHTHTTREELGFWTPEEVRNIVAESDILTWSGGGPGKNNPPTTEQDIQNVSPKTVRPFTVKAPPVGKPDGDLIEYHAPSKGVRFNYDYKFPNRKEAIKKMAWLYNWYLPYLPITWDGGRRFHNTADWIVPSADRERVWGMWHQDIASRGYISADPS